jgi:hypothetical protein
VAAPPAGGVGPFERAGGGGKRLRMRSPRSKRGYTAKQCK